MQNKPKAQSHNTFTFRGLILWGNGWSSFDDNADTKAIEKLIHTLNKLGIASVYYEDYGCDDRHAFIKKLINCAFNWRLLMKRRKKRLHRSDWIRFDLVLETRLLVNSGRHLQSHQLTQALKLVEQTSKCRYPSFFLVDSS